MNFHASVCKYQSLFSYAMSTFPCCSFKYYICMYVYAEKTEASLVVCVKQWASSGIVELASGCAHGQVPEPDV